MSFTTAFVGGLAATSLMTPLAYLAPAFRLQELDFAALLGALVTNQAAPPVSAVWLGGMLLHFVNGSLVFPAIYAAVVSPLLGGAPWLRGLQYGVILWGFAQTVVMPLAGMGLFSAASPRPVAALGWSLASHLVYGIVLGAIATPRMARALHAETRAARRRAA